MSVLRNRFLNTTAFLSAPGEPAASDKSTTLTEDVGAEDDTGGAEGDDNTAQAEGAEGDDATGDNGDDGADAEEDDEDPDLADLPPEVRAKAKAAIEKRVARETGWRDRQIDKLHAKRRSAEEDVRAAEVIAGRPAPKAENLTEEEIERRATVKAGQMSAQERYDAAANDADAKGKAAYGDKWGTTLAKLPKLGGIDISDMQDVLAADHPEVVLFSLSDPDTYDRVMNLPPARRRTEIIKLGMKEPPRRAKTETESKRPGDVPNPVRPLNNGRKVAAQKVDIYNDKADDDAWYAARNATRRKKFSDHA